MGCSNSGLSSKKQGKIIDRLVSLRSASEQAYRRYRDLKGEAESYEHSLDAIVLDETTFKANKETRQKAIKEAYKQYEEAQSNYIKERRKAEKAVNFKRITADFYENTPW